MRQSCNRPRFSSICKELSRNDTVLVSDVVLDDRPLGTPRGRLYDGVLGRLSRCPKRGTRKHAAEASTVAREALELACCDGSEYTHFQSRVGGSSTAIEFIRRLGGVDRSDSQIDLIQGMAYDRLGWPPLSGLHSVEYVQVRLSGGRDDISR